MSTFNDKVIATNAFLLNRIALRRVTNHEELQRVIGQMLFINGRRSNPFPISREKIIDACILRAQTAATRLGRTRLRLKLQRGQGTERRRSSSSER